MLRSREQRKTDIHSLTIFESSFSSGFLLSFSHSAFFCMVENYKILPEFIIFYFSRSEGLLVPACVPRLIISVVTICSGQFSHVRRAGLLVTCYPLDPVSQNDFSHSQTVTFRSSDRTGTTTLEASVVSSLVQFPGSGRIKSRL